MSNFPYEKEKPLPLHPNQKEALAIAKLKEYKQLHPYALRSFKTIQMLCDDRNYREILDSSSLFIGRFCKQFEYFLLSQLMLLFSPRAPQEPYYKRWLDLQPQPRCRSYGIFLNKRACTLHDIYPALQPYLQIIPKYWTLFSPTYPTNFI